MTRLAFRRPRLLSQPGKHRPVEMESPSSYSIEQIADMLHHWLAQLRLVASWRLMQYILRCLAWQFRPSRLRFRGQVNKINNIENLAIHKNKKPLSGKTHEPLFCWFSLLIPRI